MSSYHMDAAGSPNLSPQSIDIPLPTRPLNSRNSQTSLSEGEENLPNTSLPSFWTSSSRYSSESLPPPDRKGLFSGIFEGWRYIILGSCKSCSMAFKS